MNPKRELEVVLDLLQKVKQKKDKSKRKQNYDFDN